MTSAQYDAAVRLLERQLIEARAALRLIARQEPAVGKKQVRPKAIAREALRAMACMIEKVED